MGLDFIEGIILKEESNDRKEDKKEGIRYS